MTEGHNHVRSIFERWRRLEDAKREIADDLKDLFSEAKSHGFDTKALRAAFRQVVKDEERSAADNEHDALVDTYMAAIQGHARPAHARVEIVEEIPPHDAETGELVEVAETEPDQTSMSTAGANGAGNTGVTAGRDPQPFLGLAGPACAQDAAAANTKPAPINHGLTQEQLAERDTLADRWEAKILADVEARKVGP